MLTTYVSHLYRLIAALARLAYRSSRSSRSKDLEIIALRHQLDALRHQIGRPKINDPDRTLLGAIAAALPRPRPQGWFVTPNTLLRWHRRGIARHWTQATQGPGRPSTSDEDPPTRSPFRCREPNLGYRRIHGKLTGLDHPIASSTVSKILKTAGIDPAPQPSNVTWPQFLHSQAAVACDFFTVDTALLRRYYVLFFIHAPTRQVFFAGVTTNPTGDWTTQAARNLFLHHANQLASSRALVRSPVANTFAERWIGSIRRELLDRTIIWDQHQIEQLVVDYIEHHNGHRPHRSVDQRPPLPPKPSPEAALRVIKSTLCDELINEYRNAA